MGPRGVWFAAPPQAADDIGAGFLGAGGGAAEEQYGDLNKLARDVLLRALRLSGKVGVASALGPTEGLSAPVFVGTGEGGSAGAHAVVLHPLDGSANITCNVSVGTIFGIYRTVDRGGASPQ